jgi:cytochrome c-type biogenesis protein CcmH/NrfG
VNSDEDRLSGSNLFEIADFLKTQIGRDNDPHLKYHLAEILYQQNNVAEAEELLRDVLNSDPSHIPSILALGRILAEQGRSDELFGEYAEMVDLEAKLAEIRYGNQSQDTEVLEELSMLRNKLEGKDDFLSIYKLGEILTKACKFKEAEKAYRDALKKAPWFFEAWFGLISVLIEQKEYADAQEAIIEVKQLIKSGNEFDPTTIL